MHSSLRIFQGLTGLRELTQGSVLSIGNFDGVHLGHLRIIELAHEIRAQREAAGDGARVALVTFEPHPLTVLRPQAVPPRLTPPEMKRSLLSSAGVDDLVELPPTRDVLNLTAEEFFAILRDDVRPSHLIEGESFMFGRGRGGSIDKLREWTHGTGIELHVIDGVRAALLDMQVVDVNSSVIRWLLTNGRVRDAAICLGRPYTVEGTVVEGFKRGRTIGVPTANLQCDDQLVPGDGVYVGRCLLDGIAYGVALSIGTLPTFGEANRRQVEAHLVNFNGEMYGRRICIDLIDWVRDQRKFNGVESLKAQLARDIQLATQFADVDPSRAIATVSR
jgi:riboflavin kinase/FMN adenylyltransferase